jgi:hypothetical protein
MLNLFEICQMVEFGGFLPGGGWNFGAPQAKISSNPKENFTGFGHGERQRVEMLLLGSGAA